MTGFLKDRIRIIVLRLQMVRVISLIGHSGSGCKDRILRIFLVRSPHIPGTSHGNTMIISGSALSTHDIIPSVMFGKMRRLDTPPVRTASPDALRISNDLLFFRRVLHKADHARLLVSVSCLPFKGYEPFAPGVIMEHRSIESRRVEIHRFTPWTFDIFRSDHIVINIKISCIHGIHDPVHKIKQTVRLTVGQTGRPNSFGRRKSFQIHLFIVRQDMREQLPVFQVP